MRLRLSLDRFLATHSLTPYRLFKEVEGKLAKSSVYDLVRGDEVKRVDLSTLSAVLEGLMSLTGERLTPNDLLETVKDDSEH